MSPFSPQQEILLTTIAFHEALGMGVTSFECWRYQVLLSDVELSLEQTVLLLDELVQQGVLCTRFGFYTFVDSEIGHDAEVARRTIALIRRQYVVRHLRFLRAIPWVREVLLSGSLAFGVSNAHSDYDIFIVGKDRQLWSVAFFVSLYFQILGRRRHGDLVANRFCLNHFVSVHSVEIPYRSMYTAQTYARMYSIVAPWRSYFFEANIWIHSFIHQSFLVSPFSRYLFVGKFSSFYGFVQYCVEVILRPFGWVIERFSKRCILSIVRARQRSRFAPGRVLLFDNVLEFHRESSEASVLARANSRLQSLGIEVCFKDSGLDPHLPV